MSDILPFPIDSHTRRELVDLAATAGCDRPVGAVRAAIEAGCPESEIRAAISHFIRCDGMPADYLRQKLTTMQPGDLAEKGLPLVSEVLKAAEAKPKGDDREERAMANWRQAQAIRLVQKMRGERKSDTDIKDALARVGLEWPK